MALVPVQRPGSLLWVMMDGAAQPDTLTTVTTTEIQAILALVEELKIKLQSVEREVLQREYRNREFLGLPQSTVHYAKKLQQAQRKVFNTHEDDLADALLVIQDREDALLKVARHANAVLNDSNRIGGRVTIAEERDALRQGLREIVRHANCLSKGAKRKPKLKGKEE